MRLLVSSVLALTIIASMALLAPVPTATAGPQESAESDTGAVADTSESSPRVRISIDKSGIRVEGDAATSDDDTEWVLIDDNRDWKEKGTDIIRFGEGVFVASDELVRGDLVVIAGDVIIEGRVTGHVVVIGGDMRVRSGAEIKGDAVVIGGGELDEDEDAIIRGERVEIGGVIPFGDLDELSISFAKWSRWSFPFFLFVKIVLALLTLLFIPSRVISADDHFSDNAVKAFGVGVLSIIIGFIASCIITIPLVIMIFSIPLVLLLVVSWAGSFVIAWTVAAHAFGRLVSGRLQMGAQSSFAFVLIGTVVLSLPDLVGFGFNIAGAEGLSRWFGLIGTLLRLFVYTAGFGALVLSRFGGRPLSPAPAVPGDGAQAATV